MTNQEVNLPMPISSATVFRVGNRTYRAEGLVHSRDRLTLELRSEESIAREEAQSRAHVDAAIDSMPWKKRRAARRAVKKARKKRDKLAAKMDADRRAWLRSQATSVKGTDK